MHINFFDCNYVNDVVIQDKCQEWCRLDKNQNCFTFFRGLNVHEVNMKCHQDLKDLWFSFFVNLIQCRFSCICDLRFSKPDVDKRFLIDDYCFKY